MRILVSLLLVFFAAGLVDMPPVRAAQESSHSQCCCHSDICHCKHGTGMSCKVQSEKSTDGIFFKALGCGEQGEKAVSPSFAKDYYLANVNSEIPVSKSSPVFSILTQQISSSFKFPPENPPEFILF